MNNSSFVSEKKTIPENSESIPPIDQKKTPDGRIITFYQSGHKEILFRFCFNFENEDSKTLFAFP